MPLPSGSRTSSRYMSAARGCRSASERRRRVEHADAVALSLQDQAKRPADVRLVVDDDDVPFAGHDGSRHPERGAAELAGNHA